MVQLFRLFSLIAAVGFLAAIGFLLFLAPEVDPLRSGISFYALTPFSPVIGVALTVIGLAGIALAIALWPAVHSVAGRVGLLLLVTWGIASILAGVFPLDAPGTAPTRSGTIHNLAGLNFLLVAPAVLLIERATTAREASAGRVSGAAWLARLVVVFAILLFVFNGPLASLQIGGLVQRLYWLVLACWIIVRALPAAGRARAGAVA